MAPHESFSYSQSGGWMVSFSYYKMKHPLSNYTYVQICFFGYAPDLARDPEACLGPPKCDGVLPYWGASLIY